MSRAFVVVVAVAITGCGRACSPSRSVDASPTTVVVPDVVDTRCADSCAVGFCWDPCSAKTIAPRGDIFDVSVTEDSVAWLDKRGAHWMHKGGTTDEHANARYPIAVKNDLLVFGGEKGRWSIVKGRAAPHVVTLPGCGEGGDAVLIGDRRLAFKCSHAVTNNAGGPGLGVIQSMLSDFTVTDESGNVLGTEEFSKSPDFDSMNTVFVLRGEHVITNDNERIVELDLVTKKPLMVALGSLPKGFVVVNGVEHGPGFDVLGWPCNGHAVVSCPDEVDENLVHLEKTPATVSTTLPPTSVTLLPTRGTTRILRGDGALYREDKAGSFTPIAKTGKNLLYAAVAADGTSAVVTESGLEVRAPSPW
jgi:hypothetical protein